MSAIGALNQDISLLAYCFNISAGQIDVNENIAAWVVDEAVWLILMQRWSTFCHCLLRLEHHR